MAKRNKHNPEGLTGFDSPVCTYPTCGVPLGNGMAVQLIDDRGREQRYCPKCDVRYTTDPVRFPDPPAPQVEAAEPSS